MAEWSANEVCAYLGKRIKEDFVAGCLQKALYFSSEPTIGLEHISEHLESNINERYYCKLCNITQDPSRMYNHIISTHHRIKYFLPRDIVTHETMKKRAEDFERKHVRHCQQIKVFEKSAKQIFSKYVAVHHIQSKEPKKIKSHWPETVTAIGNTSVYDHPPELPSIYDVPQCSYEDHYVQQYPESNYLNNNSDQFYQGKDGKYSLGRNLIVDATTSNITVAIQEEVRENPETTNYSDVSRDEDAESVITVSSSTSIDMCLSDIEEESDQTTNYNFNNNYDVALGAGQHYQQLIEANCWNPTKMECLQLFMEHPEPLVIETQSQWEFVVSVIQSVSEAMEKCNVQNLPP